MRATSKMNDDTAEFEVAASNSAEVWSASHVFTKFRWNFKLIERPYKLPTKPGLYQIHKDLYDNPSPNIRIFSLLRDGRWEEFGNPGVDKTDRLKRSEWPLKRLVFED